MAVQVGKRYDLGDYRLEPDKLSLCLDDKPVHLTNRPYQVLLYLIENRDRVVTRNELLDRFWDGKDVYDDTLRKCIGAIRKALNDRSENPRFIETRYAEGYRYIGPIEEQLAQSEPFAVEIERTRGVRLVIEEEEIPDALPEYERAKAIGSSATPAPVSAPKSYYRIAIPALILVVISLATSAVIIYRNRVTLNNINESPIRSIAVMPLKNLTGDASQDYFSDGMSESLITELSRVSGLKVISRASAFTFKDRDVDAREIGERLGVAAVLEGSVRKSGDKVRVETRLVSAADGRIIWTGDSYDRALKDIFVMQDEIACSVVAGLRVKLCGEGEPLFHQHTENIEAYRAYLKGRYFINAQYSEIGPVKALNKAAEYFEQAIALDSNYALGYAGLADAYTQLLWFSSGDPRPMIAKAKAAAIKAVELDGTLAETHTALSAAYLHDWNFDGAGREIEQALALNSGYAWAHHEYSTYLGTVGRGDALAEVKKAEELDPLNIAIIVDTGNTLLGAGKYDEAIAQFRKAREIHPNTINDATIGAWYVDKGMYEEGIKEIEVAIASTGRTHDRLMSLAIGYAKAGKKKEAVRLLDEMKRLSKKQYVPNTFFAFVYAAFGEKDQAFEHLERAYREHDINLLGLKGLRLEPLRSDPRFKDLLDRVGLPE
jgi:TolB-like protein/DNA-binding winged helix-turn-helix (wHTH) protein/Tfp pilus assembly protein PilF